MMKFVNVIVLLITIIGAFNWFLLSVFSFNLQLIVYLLNLNQIIIRTKYTLEGELLKAVKK